MKIVSFFNDNIDKLIPQYQKEVFNKFGYRVDQIMHNQKHGDAIDSYLQNSEWNEIAIFDIDCIPLNNHVLNHAKAMIRSGNIFGASQRANHIPDSEVYVSPAFICFTREQYENIKCTFNETQWHDVGSLFSSEAKRLGYSLSMLIPVEVEVPKWNLTGGLMFGLGTNYQNMVYHAFESRFNHESTSMFINKCKEVLSE